MSLKKAIFLETSLQVQRSLTSSSHLNTTNAQVDRTYVTTSYVWMEFQRTVVADYVHVHHLAHKYTDWPSLLIHLLEGQRAFRPRAAVRCTRIVGKLLRQSYRDWNLARLILDTQIEYSLRHQFWTNITALPDFIGCDLVTEGIQRQTDGTYTVAERCRKEKATCHLPDFLAEKRSALEAITHYLATHPKSIKKQARVEQLLDAVRSDPRAALGQTACWPLGDLIIALQVPPDAALWTLDPDFKPLAAALGLQLHEPPQTIA